MCNGQTISADDYPELVKALGSNVLPNLNGRVLQGAETAGEYKEAGLPNITGNISATTVGNSLAVIGGAYKVFYLSDTDKVGAIKSLDSISDTATRYKTAHFDASRSNPIYGASTTVQPPAYTVKFYICWG